MPECMVSLYWESPSSFHTADFSWYPYMMEETRELSGGSFIKALIPFLRALPSWDNYLPMAPLPNHHFGYCWALGFDKEILRRTQTFRPQHRERGIWKMIEKGAYSQVWENWRQRDHRETKGERVCQRPKKRIVCVKLERRLLRKLFNENVI